MPEGRLARTRPYVPPTFDGQPYRRACGCRGELGADASIDHFACRKHEAEARSYVDSLRAIEPTSQFSVEFPWWPEYEKAMRDAR